MARSLVLSCEHATAWIPRVLDLGVDEPTRTSHLGWDPGAPDLAVRLALATGAPLLMAPVSRLVVDANRSRTNPDVVASQPFGADVPGNAGLSPQEIEARLTALHDPWCRALRAEVDRLVELGDQVTHISVHSFTPELNGVRRQVQVGLLYDPERPAEVEVAAQLIEAAASLGLDARANEPYPGWNDGTTTWLRRLHADPVYSGLELEVRQDLLPRWEERIAEVVLSVLG